MAKLIDLTGQIFDDLTVISKAPSRARHVYWHCKCSCGTEVDVSGESLRKNIPHNCGCKLIKNQKKVNHRQLHLLGQRFGKLVVVEELQERNHGSIMWKCQCDCGNYKNVPTHQLTGGKTKSCGCLIFETKGIDITGQRFGKLVAIQRSINRKTTSTSAEWVCQCDCGNIVKVQSYSLRKGLIRSCGCINYSIGEYNIIQILSQNKIKYIKEYTAPDLISPLQKPYRFDFYLPEINRLIEFDGEQHYLADRGTWDNKENLQIRQSRDKEKNQWALIHNIPLVRIPYWEKNNITLEMILGNQYLI